MKLNGIEIPSLVVRRANTTVELRSGESFAIAGLFQQNYSNAVRQLPGVGQVPVLGSLFRSSRWQKAETELVIIVTPRMAGGDDYHATSTILAGNEATAIDLILNGLALDKPMAKVEGSAKTGRPHEQLEPAGPPGPGHRRQPGALARGPLFGAAMEVAGLDRLTDLRPGMTDLILIDADHAEPAALAAAVATLAGVADLPPTLFLGGHLPVGLVRALMRLPHADVVEAPFTHEQLQNAIYALLDQAAAQAQASGPPLPLLVGPGRRRRRRRHHGGHRDRQRSGRPLQPRQQRLPHRPAPGRRRLRALPRRDSSMGLAEFGPAAERMDAALLAAFATPVAKGLDLLACPRDPTAFTAISREAVLRILEIACEAYDHVVLDMPRHRHSWSLDALTGSDEVVVVSELTVPALLAARALSEEIEAAAALRPRIVLNRLANRMFGPALHRRSREGPAAQGRRRHRLGLGGGRRLGQSGRRHQPAPAQVENRPRCGGSGGPPAGRPRPASRALPGRRLVASRLMGRFSPTKPVALEVVETEAPTPPAERAPSPATSDLAERQMLDVKLKLHAQLIEELDLSKLESVGEELRRQVMALVGDFARRAPGAQHRRTRGPRVVGL
uniref:Type II/III secretion system secretin-like domain-containing protein n=1 Tax=Phenylobacterium glaciei TaxID=2803784 RepID=A0A974P153_9CAUL|nr:hypothetical protein JKL49_17440 [Phenylobacterium glaciei]